MSKNVLKKPTDRTGALAELVRLVYSKITSVTQRHKNKMFK